MKIGDLVRTRWRGAVKHSQPPGIIMADGSLSWQRESQMWRVQFPDGKRIVCFEHQLEVVSSCK